MHFMYAPSHHKWEGYSHLFDTAKQQRLTRLMHAVRRTSTRCWYRPIMCHAVPMTPTTSTRTPYCAAIRPRTRQRLCGRGSLHSSSQVLAPRASGLLGPCMRCRAKACSQLYCPWDVNAQAGSCCRVLPPSGLT